MIPKWATWFGCCNPSCWHRKRLGVDSAEQQCGDESKQNEPCTSGEGCHRVHAFTLLSRCLQLNCCYQACLLKNLGSGRSFLSLPVSWLFASFVSSGQVHAVAICGVDLLRRNRTSRFRFCAVAAR